MNEVTIISVSGQIKSGKNYLADLLVDQFGYKSLMLAAIPKEIVCRVHGITLKELEDRKNKEKYRPEIISYAEKLKEVNLHIFCNDVHQLILKDLNSSYPTYRYVISDMRYPFESLYFHKLARCSQVSSCEKDYRGIPSYKVTYKSLYIESDLADKSSKADSESHYDYFKKNSDGIITNGKVEREDSAKLVNQIVKFL